MCLILLALNTHPRCPLVLAANRDEFYDRPTAAADFWQEAPDVLAGRDLKDGGTWLGITKKGRIAALTNYRDPASIKIDPPSRGWLVRNYLQNRESPEEYIAHLAERSHEYNGFGLIVGDSSRLAYYSNRAQGQTLSAGLHGLSNSILDTPWPKVERGGKLLGDYLSRTDAPSAEDLLDILADRSRPDDAILPDTGVGIEWERLLSPVFITSPEYGTRSSTVVLIDGKGHVTFAERSFNSHPDPWMTSRFDFRIGLGEKGGSEHVES